MTLPPNTAAERFTAAANSPRSVAEAQSAVGTLAVCSRRGRFSRTVFFSHYLPFALHFGRLAVEAADVVLSAHSARRRTAVSRAHPTWAGVW